jgi:hypothetical protein
MDRVHRLVVALAEAGLLELPLVALSLYIVWHAPAVNAGA